MQLLVGKEWRLLARHGVRVSYPKRPVVIVGLLMLLTAWVWEFYLEIGDAWATEKQWDRVSQVRFVGICQVFAALTCLLSWQRCWVTPFCSGSLLVALQSARCPSTSYFCASLSKLWPARQQQALQTATC